MATQLDKISAAEQRGVLESFWTMLKECEERANVSDGSELLLRHWVSEWYKQWNRVTGSNCLPIWEMRKTKHGDR